MGDLTVCRGDLISGRLLLLQAATIFGRLDDWTAESEALRRLRDVRWHADGRGTLPAVDDATCWDLASHDVRGAPQTAFGRENDRHGAGLAFDLD
jgi:hypothetical protein